MDLSKEKGSFSAIETIKIFLKNRGRSVQSCYMALSSTQRITALLYIALLTSLLTGMLALMFVVAAAYTLHKKLKGSDAGKYNEVFLSHLKQCYMLPTIYTITALSFTLFDASLSHTKTIPTYYLEITSNIIWVMFFTNIIYYHLLLLINLYRLWQFKKPIANYISPIKKALMLPVLLCKHFIAGGK